MRYWLFILFCGCIGVTTINAQTEEFPGQNKFHIEFLIGLNLSQPIGSGAKAERNRPETKVTAKPSAYIGFRFDYKVRPKVGFGSGLVYIPTGRWVTQDLGNGDRVRSFYTVDYIQMPLFAKVYVNDLISMRVGPVFNMMAVNSIRVKSSIGDQTYTDRFRMGEEIALSNNLNVPVNNTLPKAFNGGFDATLTIGRLDGAHANIGFEYWGSIYQDQDFRTIMAKLGFGYTIQK